MTMTRWSHLHVMMAARQGWCISEVSGEDHAPWEIQRVDDAVGTGAGWGVEIPQLDSDEAAVQVMRAAYHRGEPHAVLAYCLLCEHSPAEFACWRMGEWAC